MYSKEVVTLEHNRERTKYMSIVLHEGFIARLVLYLRHEEKG